MSARTTVVRAYVGSARVIANSRGEVYTPERGWVPTVEPVIPVRGTYERWCDVPQAWIGYAPYWNNR